MALRLPVGAHRRGGDGENRITEKRGMIEAWPCACPSALIVAAVTGRVDLPENVV